MRREMARRRWELCAVGLTLGACGCGGTQGALHESPDGGVDGAASPESGSPEAEAALVACRHYHVAQYVLGCGGPVLPTSEAQRVEARFVQVCLHQMALPGSGMNAATVERCAEALSASPCELNWGLPAECRFQGTLPGGAVCNDSIQCQSGRCTGTALDGPGGQVGPYACGTCAPVAAVGEVCGQGNFSAGCAGNAACVVEPGMETAATPTYACTALVAGDVGAACDDLTKTCKTGLYCATQTGTCIALGSAGAPCGEGPGRGAPGGCVKPLSCVGLPGMATCTQGAPGSFCLNDLDCPAGSGCIPGPCSTTVARIGCSESGTCGPVTWVS
ncbi:MAG TPA: hypothetical protein VKU41_19675, partial [Polyangiaceae bacterium]|nr:hypothetical protein [Polyangiaceae bacterium]